MKVELTTTTATGPHLDYDRKREIETRLQELFKKFCAEGSLDNPSVFVGLSAKDVPSVGKKYMKIPYLMLFRLEDIPENLRITGKDDPKLYSDVYLLKLLRWTEQMVEGVPKQQMDLKTTEALRMFMKFLLDPENAERAKDFVLGHELAHKLYKHSYHGVVAENNFKEFKKSAMIFFMTLGHAIFVPNARIGLLVVTMTTTIYAVKLFKSISESHRCERQADLKSASLLGREVTMGGIYLFETLREHQKGARKMNLWLRLAYSPSGDRRTSYVTHPSESTRVNYLRDSLLCT